MIRNSQVAKERRFSKLPTPTLFPSPFKLSRISRYIFYYINSKYASISIVTFMSVDLQTGYEIV